MATKTTVLLGLITLCALSGCGGDNDIEPQNTYKVIEIDQCEYIFVSRRPWAGDFSLTHKGNCKNPIHIYAGQTRQGAELKP